MGRQEGWNSAPRGRRGPVPFPIEDLEEAHMSMTEPRTSATTLRWRARIRDRHVEVEWVDGEFRGDLEVTLRLEHLPSRGVATTPDEARALIGCVLLDPVEVVEPFDAVDQMGV
jgi:hypothetical protein